MAIDTFPNSSINLRDKVGLFQSTQQEIVVFVTAYSEKCFDIQSIKLLKKLRPNLD